jgi:hypothetical protein
VYHHYHIDVPVQVKYTFFKKKKISLYALAGAEANFNVANKYTTTIWYGNEKERETREIQTFSNEFQKYNCSVIAGIGMDVAFNSRIALFVQPTYRQMLIPMMDAPIRRRLYLVGLTTGVTVSI